LVAAAACRVVPDQTGVIFGLFNDPAEPKINAIAEWLP
jgi:hypothetical protein